ncbi:GGDEF domain-containing protein [Terrihabitans rhizophilus]|uniref:diguanylate cyclase n=1 Tax=Terrihabitans rhizophilus TaxID=3092662 RepID=A0ABU4RML3_9HYPH|nr:GGDEF domain-containing protein [Terrihabitans sp. PJ23]MDX6805344.1 GGDEF domain-containing protein [Terrihabitans sp. PJ23]
MLLDYTSLLLAAGFSAAALALTLIATWLSSRAEAFLLTWAIGIATAACGVPLFGLYTAQFRPLFAWMAFVCFSVGLSTILGAARQFRRRRFSLRRVILASIAAIASFTPGFLAGHDGIGFICFNVAAAAIILATAYEYRRCRAEAPTAVAGLLILYVNTAISFLCCAFVLPAAGNLRLTAPPQNWAEYYNAISAIIGITGIGAISLALHQTRLARHHRHDAQTDELTKLMNRRALLERFGARNLPARTAVIIFDLDHFKLINDRYGHGVGDSVLICFAAIVAEHLPAGAMAARLGGEEVAVVLTGTTFEDAMAYAETIRAVFEKNICGTDEGSVSCTVSGGLTFQTEAGAALSDLLGQADMALYSAKGGGRNRIATASMRLVA